MPELSRNPDDYETIDAYAHAQALNAGFDLARPGFDWAIGGNDIGWTHTEYAIEATPGDGARCATDELAGAVEDLASFQNGARIISRTVTYGPWRYVTPDEIEREAADWYA